MEATDFLATLYDKLHGDERAAVELRAIRNEGGFDARLFTQDQNDIRAFLNRYNATAPVGVYYGVAPRIAGRRTGKKDDVLAIPALWCDVDVVKLGWDMKLTIGALKQHALRPSAMINSGYGLHLYWLLEKPIMLSAEGTSMRRNEIDLVEDDMRFIANVFAGDNTVDVTRVLRLPGTFNTKDPAKPKEVDLVFADWREWNWRDLGEGAKNAESFLDKDGWISKEEMKKRRKEAEKKGDLLGTVNALTSAAGLRSKRFTSWDQIWQHTKYHGGGRGTAYIGLDEAILRATAYARVFMPHHTDEQIIANVMREVKRIKDKQAWGERWDMDKEHKEVVDKLARWNVRWAEIQKQRSAEANVARRKRS